ncbi:hypothetical protein [Subtercola boreus]|nr:hypothetical protein [Subtercola boreus]
MSRRTLRTIVALHALMKEKGDGAKKIWITEYGSPTNLHIQQQ